jgi:ketosteroid isomerase-like protein
MYIICMNIMWRQGESRAPFPAQSPLRYDTLYGEKSRRKTVVDFKAAARAIFNTYSRTLNDGDLERWIALWEDDGVQMPPNSRSRKGKVAIMSAMKADVRAFGMKDFTIVLAEAIADRELGFASGSCSYVRTDRQSGNGVTIEGKFLTVFRKAPDGTWKIFRDCVNSDEPPH